MAMKKADMETHNDKYESLMRHARKAAKKGMYSEAVKASLDAWEHIDGMMQYRRKYEDQDFASIEAIDLVLKYAPPLFDFECMNKLQTLLKECRRIERNTSRSLADKLAEARSMMWDARTLWNHIGANPGIRQDSLGKTLGGNQNRWRALAEAWAQMQLLNRVPQGRSYCLSLTTRMGGVINAKCPNCGEITEAPKAMLLETLQCPQCTMNVHFVLLDS